MIDRMINDISASYDAVADEYVQRIFNELEHKSLDRELLDRLVSQVQGRGPICDLGCGPGHVARYLQGRGAQVVGIDLSPRMVELARTLNPGVEFQQGDMRSLHVEGEAFAGIAAFYSIIHISRPEVTAVLVELNRILRPGGVLLLAFHIGDDVVQLDEWWGKTVSIEFVFFHPEEMAGFLLKAGFEVKEVVEREPYAGVEHASRRAYILAEKPAGNMPDFVID